MDQLGAFDRSGRASNAERRRVFFTILRSGFFGAGSAANAGASANAETIRAAAARAMRCDEVGMAMSFEATTNGADCGAAPVARRLVYPSLPR
jgi:hypothetical protein